MSSEADKIEITEAMVAAGAKVLWNGTDLDIGPSGARILAESVIEAALKCRRENSVGE